jgi:ribonucleoside-diphosphate reductase alpha chain
MEHIYEGGSIQDRPDVPQWVKDVYVTSDEISSESHVLMQSAFQKSCDSGISKTINFPNSATVEDVYSAYMIAWQSKCKGITVYRSGSREKEVLVKAETPKSEDDLNITTYDYLENLIDAPFLTKGESAQLDTCCGSPFIVEEGGCSSCKACGWSKCHVS